MARWNSRTDYMNEIESDVHSTLTDNLMDAAAMSSYAAGNCDTRETVDTALRYLAESTTDRGDNDVDTLRYSRNIDAIDDHEEMPSTARIAITQIAFYAYYCDLMECLHDLDDSEVAKIAGIGQCEECGEYVDLLISSDICEDCDEDDDDDDDDDGGEGRIMAGMAGGNRGLADYGGLDTNPEQCGHHCQDCDRCGF